MKYRLESFYRVYDNMSEMDYFWEIGLDADSGTMVQVSYYENGVLHPNQQVVASPEAAKLIAKAIAKVTESLAYNQVDSEVLL